jgi:hypothetical protein
MRDGIELAEIRRELAALKRDRRAESRDYWLRCVGYLTRPMVYFSPLALLAWWLWQDLSSQPISSLAMSDLLVIGGVVLAFFGGAIPLVLFFFNVDGGVIKWETWGRFGLLLAAGLPVGVLLVALS